MPDQANYADPALVSPNLKFLLRNVVILNARGLHKQVYRLWRVEAKDLLFRDHAQRNTPISDSGD